MRKLILVSFLSLTFLLVSCTEKIENVDTAHKIGESILFQGFNVVVEEAYVNPLETPSRPDETVLYIFIKYPNDQTIYSHSVWIQTLDFKKIDYYRVDGLDYLGGVQRAERAFVRFSVPKDESQFILYLDIETRILISLGE